MPPKPPIPATSLQGHRTLYSTITGIIAFAGITIVVSRLGLEPVAAVVFSALSAFAIAAFVYRERTLLLSLNKLEVQLYEHQSNLHARIEHWYDHSGVALVKYDVSTLIIVRMGAGCAELLGIESERSMSGARLEEILQVEASRLEILTEQIRKGTSHGNTPLTCRGEDGREFEVRISGVYLPEEHAMEVVLISNQGSLTGDADLQETMDDLERFRKGMMRREKRILDLKAEVNEVLADADQSPRYEIDANTGDTKVRAMSTSKQEAED